jgi:hypothetical protein
MLVLDMGSIDATWPFISGIAADMPTFCDVGAAMVARQKLIAEIPRDPECWMVTLDADEVWPESQIRALIHRMSDPEIDFIAVRPVALGQDCNSMYAPHYFDPERIEDRLKYTTEHWCDKWSTRAYRASRGITVSDARWGCEVYSCEIQPWRDTLTPDFKEESVPAHHASTMYLNRTAWTDIYFNHITNFTRSTKWAEIQQIENSNAMDRARWRSRGKCGHFPLPHFFEVPESVRRIAASE